MVISVCNDEDFRQLALEAFQVLIIEILQKRNGEFRTKPNLSQELSKLQPSSEFDNSDLEPIKTESEIKEQDIEEGVTPAGRDIKNMNLDRLSLVSEIEESKEIITKESSLWNSDDWQAIILQPFIDSISSQPYEEEQLAILKHIDKIIDICYEQINDNGWEIIINFLKDLKFNRISEAASKKAYDIVEILSCNFIDFIEGANLENLIRTIRRFASYHQGQFEFHKSSDKNKRDSRGSKIYKRIFKYLVLKDVDEDISINSDSEEESKKNILEESKHPATLGHEISTITAHHFELLFEEVGMLFNDFLFNFKIRKALLRSVKYMMRNMPSNCDSSLWEKFISSIILGMVDKSIGKYLEQLGGFSTSKAREVKQHEITQSLQTPTFSLGGGGGGDSSDKKDGKKKNERRMKFNDEVINRFHQRSEDIEPISSGFGAAPEETPKTIKPSQESLDDQNILLLLLEI